MLKSLFVARRDIAARAALKTFEGLRSLGVGPMKAMFLSGITANAVVSAPRFVIVGAARVFGGKKAAAIVVLSGMAAEAAAVKAYGVETVTPIETLYRIAFNASTQYEAEKTARA